VDVVIRLKEFLHMDTKTAGHRPEEFTKLCVKHFSSIAGVFKNTLYPRKQEIEAFKYAYAKMFEHCLLGQFWPSYHLK
jgi:hypothetical protein